MTDDQSARRKNPATHASAALAAALEFHRKQATLTKRAFAKKAGVSNQYLHELLNGEGNPTLETLELIASRLGLDFDPTFRPRVERHETPKAPIKKTAPAKPRSSSKAAPVRASKR